MVLTLMIIIRTLMMMRKMMMLMMMMMMNIKLMMITICIDDHTLCTQSLVRDSLGSRPSKKAMINMSAKCSLIMILMHMIMLLTWVAVI